MPDREFIMSQWDHIRDYFKDGDDGGSHPRDVFENILDQYEEALAALTRELEEARATAFEEAAKIGDGHRDASGGYVAFAIRQHANGLSRTDGKG